MKKFYIASTYRRFIFLAAVSLFAFARSGAQTTITTLPNPPYNGGNSLAGPSNITFVLRNNNPFPVNLTAISNWCNTTENGAIFELYYTATALSGATTDVTVAPWSIVGTSLPTTVAANGITALNFPGLNFTIPAGTQYRFALRNNGVGPGNTRYSGTGAITPNTFTGGGVELLCGDVQIAGSNVGYSGSGTGLTLTPRYYTGSVTFEPAGPCVEPPVPGTVGSSANPVCIGVPFTLNLTGGTGGTGQTYQWQSSPDNVVWTDIIGATSSTLTTSQITSTYYRAKVTCGVTTVESAGLQVITPAAPSGVFTINSAQPTSATNFQTFAAAYAFISCGISGPVVFNVDPASGPYNEQLIMTEVPNASATNTVTFNGNGRVISFLSTTTGQRAVIKLDGADHIIFDSLTINALGTATTEYGFGVQLINNADSNIIRNCTINITDNSTSTNYAGIVISNSHTSATTTGATECDGNLFQENIITGGYYGFTNVGSSTVANQRNSYINNIVRDYYLYGFYNNGTFQTLIDGNDISRPARANIGTATSYAIYFTSLSTSAKVNGNRIHGLLDTNPSSTNDVYGIFFTGVDALGGLENVVSNNAIYDIRSEGAIFGLANTSSNNIFYYHNTVSLDDQLSTSTQTARGFYQTTLASGIVLKNNLITISRGGTGEQHAIFMNTSTTTFESNYNDFYVAAAANRFVGYNGTDQATLANWQTATSQDANSVSVNPLYVNMAAGDLMPTAAALNDLGTPVGILTDILGAPRSATTPDIGAWEFTVGACTVPPTPGESTSSISVPVCPNELVVLNLQNNSIGIGQTYQWESASSLAGPWTPISGVQNSPSFNINPTVTLYYRAAVTCSGNTQYSTPVQVVVNALFPAGTYTINSAVPTGGTNFQSFGDAVFAMRCGIAGPVIFNVDPASGPYTEQVIIPQIQGTSATNTITFNGNGRILQYLSTSTDERAVIKLFGADHIIIDSLTINALGTTTSEYGFGIHLIGDADSNIVRNSAINITDGSTSTNFAGIVISNSHSSATTTGDTQCDGNLFTENTVTGGYYGFTNVGSSTVANQRNSYTKNIIRDYYLYGIYTNGTFQTLIDSNDISRPARSNTGTATSYAIYFTGLSTSAKVNGNRIHGLLDVNPTGTNDVYGIYFTGVDALGGLENVVSNNAIYDIKSNGAIYGMYNSSSNNIFYYHNTISLDDENSTSTDVTRGIYQTTLASGIVYKNNIVTVSRGGSGEQHAIFMNTNTTTFESDYNNFYVKVAPNRFVGYWDGVDYATLVAWRAGATQDANSLSVKPFYTDIANGNLEPRQALLDNKGTPVGITEDIEHEVRSATTPDIGAWEFIVPPCIAPPDAGEAAATPNSNICLGDEIFLELNGNSIGAGQTYQWQYSANAGGPWTNLGNVMQFPDTTIHATTTLYYRVVVTCGTQSADSDPVLVTVNPAFLAGTYTINNTQPTGGTNFNSFVEAVAALECGITGPVIFNVAAGTYTEQVRMHAIAGSSPVNTVTFRSASGDPTSVILTYNATSSAANYVLLLDSASNIIYRDMTFTATNTTNGRAVQLANTASNDSILNNIINVPNSTSTSNAIAGVFADDLGGSGNVIKGNTVNGGSSGIYFAGTSTALPTRNNFIDSNTVNNTYYYGIYVGMAQFTSVSKNTVNVTAPRNTTNYGIYNTSNDSAYQVNDNLVTITGTANNAYGIYLTGCAADQVQMGSVSRNRVMAFTGITDVLYGIYQTSSIRNYTANNVVHVNTSSTTAYGMYTTGGGGIKFYNNSVQNSSPNTGTSNIAAYFNMSSGTSGITDIRNNIFHHTAGGIASYQGNVNNIYLDYNMYYTSGSILIRQGSTNYATLQAWRDAENWDYNAIVYPPAFDNDELEPDVADPNVWAMHGRGVQIEDNASDINGNPRPITLIAGVPDLGAYEFLPTSTPPVLPATPAAPAPGITQTFMFGTDTVQKVTWAPASTVPTNVEVRRYSGIIPPGLTSGQLSMYFYADVDVTGAQPSDYKMEQFYIDPWMNNIPSEPVVKLGRTDNGGVWQVGSGGAVDIYLNVISESGLNFMDKFTGMTDGNAAPPPPDLYTLDTSNRGRRFWVGYGHHHGFSTNGQDMVLYLSAEDSANVTVRVKGTGWVRHYAIPANTVRVSDLLPESGLVDARLTDEGLFPKGISIESDVPIVAYAHIYQGSNSGAGMLLPTGAYGYEYNSLNYKQYYPTGGAGSYSWFYVIADRDSTLVEITPSVTTKGGRPAGVPFTIYLNKGDVYNVMGTINGANGTDLTGSRIRSIPNASGKCYPIAVFSGSSRNAICNTTNGDNFIQQVFPSQAWGTKYLTFATASSQSNTTYYSNIWRVMVKDPNTVVRRNGTVIPQASLVTPGNYYEFSVTQGTGASTASYIEADKPVMVAQYMISSDGDDCGITAPGGDGDPEMIYISPIEQGIKKAVFYNTDESGINSNYINVIIPTAGLASLTIDGNSTFTDVFAHPHLAGYSCVRHNLGGAAAQHIIESDSAFNAITYGLGSVESYGYNAGTLVKNLNALPTISNIFSAGGASAYTCEGTPFKLRLRINVKPDTLVWHLSGVSQLSPNASVTQNFPTASDSTFVNGQWIYTFELPLNYTFNATGNFIIPITIYHPSIEGCSGSQEISLPVNVIEAPEADFTISGAACVGNSIQFNGTSTTANGVATNQWNWTFGDGGTANVQNPAHTYNTAGTFDVNLQAIADDGCVGDTTKQVVINDRPVVELVSDTLFTCINDDATFTVQNPIAGATYNWYDQATGGNLLGTGTTYTISNVTAITSVYVEGIVTGCASLARTQATAMPMPTLTNPIAVVDSVGSNMLRFRWNAVANATGYEVSINGGSTWTTPSSGPTGLTHTITGLNVGTTITLQVRALGGCDPALSNPVSGTTVTEQVYIPNAFTPNGDGLNDIFRVYGNFIRDMHFVVYNQWGERIFESRSQSIMWDGTHKGKPQPSGVYIYVADIILTDGQRIQRKGAINLVR